MIVLVLLFSGRHPSESGPGADKKPVLQARGASITTSITTSISSAAATKLRDDNREHGDSGDRGINGDFDIPPGTPRQTDTHEAVTRGREPRSEGTNIRHVVGHING
ncbi:hypothetical protein KUCAC02_036962 [Chaenocephalus aceratus]|nr:hypothetical protein KUCAC02_036962 [Chaenocephalus aceratus]